MTADEAMLHLTDYEIVVFIAWQIRSAMMSEVTSIHRLSYFPQPPPLSFAKLLGLMGTSGSVFSGGNSSGLGGDGDNGASSHVCSLSAARDPIPMIGPSALSTSHTSHGNSYISALSNSTNYGLDSHGPRAVANGAGGRQIGTGCISHSTGIYGSAGSLATSVDPLAEPALLCNRDEVDSTKSRRATLGKAESRTSVCRPTQPVRAEGKREAAAQPVLMESTLVKTFDSYGRMVQIRLLSRTVTPAEYDAATRRSPRACPLLLAGDRRNGHQLLAETAADHIHHAMSAMFGASPATNAGTPAAGASASGAACHNRLCAFVESLAAEAEVELTETTTAARKPLVAM